MIRENFTPNAPGELVRITDEAGNRGLAFLPSRLPVEIDLTSRALRLALSKADAEVARLDGIARNIPDAESLFGNTLRREALLSSRIEGTRTTLADLALFDLVQTPPDDDSRAVANYVEAYNYGRQRCHDLPVGVGLLTELHGILMSHADSGRVTPGRLRERTVVIGTPPPNQARFVPPPSEFVRELLENLEDYVENYEEADLIKLAIAHYQFETIHPFVDGNGRVGRILISACLERKNILTAPMLYISAYFQQHQQEYYDRLLRVSTNGEWEPWILFFLDAVATQSRDSVIRASNLHGLREKYHKMVKMANGRSHKTYELIDALFAIPVMSVPHAVDKTGLTYAAAKVHVAKLIELGILGAEPHIFKDTQYYFPGELLRAIEGSLPEGQP